jgi:hypothetical protein
VELSREGEFQEVAGVPRLLRKALEKLSLDGQSSISNRREDEPISPTQWISAHGA